MGNDGKKSVFLEFYGLPGCGKSTVSHLVAEKLRNLGNDVMEPTYDMDHKCSAGIRKIRKLLILGKYAVVHPRGFLQLARLVKKNGYTGSEGIAQAANIAQKLWIYEHADASYVIFDEGLTQSAISLSQGLCSSRENEAALYQLCRKRTVLKIYMVVSTAEVQRRMASRDRHDSRIEKIQDAAQREAALGAFERQCEGIPEGTRIMDADIVSCISRVTAFVSP